MTKQDGEYFKNSTKCWICDNDYIENNVKVRYHCHITGKYRGSAHIEIVISSLKSQNSCLISQPKKLWFLSYYARTREIQSWKFKLESNKKSYLKCTSKPSYISLKIFDGNLVAIRKTKFGLKLNKPAYIGMCILYLSKVLMNSAMIKIHMATNRNHYS